MVKVLLVILVFWGVCAKAGPATVLHKQPVTLTPEDIKLNYLYRTIVQRTLITESDYKKYLDTTKAGDYHNPHLADELAKILLLGERSYPYEETQVLMEIASKVLDLINQFPEDLVYKHRSDIQIALVKTRSLIDGKQFKAYEAIRKVKISGKLFERRAEAFRLVEVLAKTLSGNCNQSLAQLAIRLPD